MAVTSLGPVEAVENPLFDPQSPPEWRDPHRAIRHFTVGVLESPSRQRRLSGQSLACLPAMGVGSDNFSRLRVFQKVGACATAISYVASAP